MKIIFSQLKPVAREEIIYTPDSMKSLHWNLFKGFRPIKICSETFSTLST